MIRPIYVNMGMGDWSLESPDKQFKWNYGTMEKPKDEHHKGMLNELRRSQRRTGPRPLIEDLVTEESYEKAWHGAYESFIQDFVEVPREDILEELLGAKLAETIRTGRF